MTRHVVRDLVAAGVLRVEDGNHGNDRPRPDEFVVRGIAFIRAADMTSGVVDFTGAGKINAVARRRIRKGVGAPGDIILSHKGTVGRVAVAPLDSPDFVCSPQTTFWRALDEEVIDRRFLAYVLRSDDFQQQLSALAGQTDMAPYASLTDQRSMTLELPCITSQRRIGGLLGTLDDKIAANDNMTRLLDELSAALVSRAAAKGEESRLGDILRLAYGKALPASDRVDGEVRVYGSGGLVGVHDRALVNGPGIVVGRKGTVGAVYWSHGPHFPIDTTYFVEPADDVPAEVLYFLLRRMRLAELNSDSAVPGLNRDRAYAQMVRSPRGMAAACLRDTLRVHLAMAAGLEVENQRLTRLRDELLRLLMSGRVRVRDAEKMVEGVT